MRAIIFLKNDFNNKLLKTPE